MRALLPALLLCAAASAAGQTVLDEHVAMRAAQVPQADAALAALRLTAATGDAATLAAQLATFDQTLATGDIARERVVFEGLLLLLGLAPDDRADALLAEWALRQPRVRVWLREGGHRAAIPLYDPGAAARSVQRRWEVIRARDVALENLHAGIPMGAWPPAVKRGDSEAARDGIVLAVRAARIDTLKPLESAIISGLANGEPLTEVAAALHERLPTPALTRALADYGAPAVLTHTLGLLLTGSDNPAALLERLIRRQPLASAALIAAAPLANDASIRELLIRRLSDRNLGGSAALALARSAQREDAILDTLARLASAKTPDPLVRSRAQLALTLHAQAAHAGDAE